MEVSQATSTHERGEHKDITGIKNPNHQANKILHENYSTEASPNIPNIPSTSPPGSPAPENAIPPANPSPQSEIAHLQAALAETKSQDGIAFLAEITQRQDQSRARLPRQAPPQIHKQTLFRRIVRAIPDIVERGYLFFQAFGAVLGTSGLGWVFFQLLGEMFPGVRASYFEPPVAQHKHIHKRGWDGNTGAAVGFTLGFFVLAGVLVWIYLECGRVKQSPTHYEVYPGGRPRDHVRWGLDDTRLPTRPAGAPDPYDNWHPEGTDQLFGARRGGRSGRGRGRGERRPLGELVEELELQIPEPVQGAQRDSAAQRVGLPLPAWGGAGQQRAGLRNGR